MSLNTLEKQNFNGCVLAHLVRMYQIFFNLFPIDELLGCLLQGRKYWLFSSRKFVLGINLCTKAIVGGRKVEKVESSPITQTRSFMSIFSTFPPPQKC